MFLKTKSFLCYIKVLLVRLACLVRFQARVRLLVHAWYFRLLSRLCWCPVRPNFGRTQARHLPGSPTQSKTFFCQVHVWLMFDSKNGIPARVRLDYVSVWFKNFIRVVSTCSVQDCRWGPRVKVLGKRWELGLPAHKNYFQSITRYHITFHWNLRRRLVKN